MNVTGLYPVLLSDDVASTAAFYRDMIGLEITYETDWYVSMRTGAFELAILAYDHETIPEGYRSPSQGVIVNVEVADVDAVHERVSAQEGVEFLLGLRDEDFGQRHFILAAPGGVLLDVIQPIPPVGDYVDAYTEAG